MSHEKEPELFADRPLMTMRVSHDSGKSWEPEQAVFISDDLPVLMTSAWPPCRCWHCTDRDKS